MTNTAELNIMIAALPVVEAVPATQDDCWPGDGPAHDDHCQLADHTASTAAVAATEGLSWEFSTWTATASWFREVIARERETHVFAGINAEGEWRIIMRGTEREMRGQVQHIEIHSPAWVDEVGCFPASETTHWQERRRGEKMRHQIYPRKYLASAVR